MLRRALSILLATIIATCPIVCKWKVASGAATSGGGCCCCHMGDEQRPNTDHRCPADHPPRSSGKCCQCICGGALVTHVTMPHTGPEISWPVAAPPKSFAVGFEYAASGKFLVAPPPPDGSMNPGRALRCLFSTFLC